MRRTFDAIVIGGGPAGAVSALLLARAGWAVALIERGRRHRDKACGHCLNPRATSLLQRLELLEAVVEQAAGRTRRFRLHHGGQDATLLDVDEPSADGAGLVVARDRFDQLLIDHAAESGAVVFQPARGRVIECGTSRAGIELRRDGALDRLACQLLVGADGLGSPTAVACGLASRAPAGRNYGFSFRLRRPAAPVVEPGTIEMFIGPGGYLGVVNQGGGVLHVAALVSPSGAPRRDPVGFAVNMAARSPLLRAAGLDDVCRDELEHLAAAGPMPWRRRTVARGPAALVGDAAGFIEPITGEGMTWAIHGAMLLAGTATACCGARRWTPDHARRYNAAWQYQVARRQRLCRLLAAAIHRPALLALLAPAARMNRSAVGRLTRHVLLT